MHIDRWLEFILQIDSEAAQTTSSLDALERDFRMYWHAKVTLCLVSMHSHTPCSHFMSDRSTAISQHSLCTASECQEKQIS